MLKLAADTPPVGIGESILFAALILFAVALIFGALIMWLSKVLDVPEDPKIAEVNGRLAGANCGGCGFAGCVGYAKALVEGTAELGKCGGADNVAIGEILGVKAPEPTIVTVSCVGGKSAQDKYAYSGYADCVANNNTYGGKKLCSEGCLGLGSCTAVCPKGAITVGVDGYAVVDHTQCMNCGLCIAACPKGLVKRLPATAKVQVGCSSKCAMRDAKARGCDKGCIKCGKCEKTCPSQAITLQGNVPVIDYGKCGGCGLCADACPKKVIKKL